MGVEPASENLSSVSSKMAPASSDSMVFSVVVPFCCILPCIKVPVWVSCGEVDASTHAVLVEHSLFDLFALFYISTCFGSSVTLA